MVTPRQVRSLRTSWCRAGRAEQQPETAPRGILARTPAPLASASGNQRRGPGDELPNGPSPSQTSFSHLMFKPI